MLNGKVEKIEPKLAKNDKQYFLLTINGKLFGYWKLLPENLEKDSEVEYSYETKQVGEKTFDNITEIKVISQKELPTEEPMNDIKKIYLHLEEIQEMLIELNRKVNSLLPEPKFENATVLEEK